MTDAENAYQEEQEKLASVVQAIRRHAQKTRDQMPVYADYARTADAIQKVLQRSAATVESALEQPYFGRLDYLVQDPQEDNPRTIYIGAAQVPDTNVCSWTAPVARLWYTNDSKYTAPRGEIVVRVDLKRFLRIRDQQLLDLNDIYRRALPEGATGKAGAANPALVGALSGVGTSDGHLDVIIQTIVPEQYESIANVSDQVLVVQGAAGSGKSEIGLHRIAYLLSPFNELPENETPTAATTLFIGPSRSFLEYAADVLPSLGVRENVPQITLPEWFAERLSERVAPSGKIWNHLLDSGRLTRYNEPAERFKGSMAMADTLDRYAASLSARIRRAGQQTPPLSVSLDGQNRFSVSQSDIKAIFDAVISDAGQHPALNRQRQEFSDRIANRVSSIRYQPDRVSLGAALLRFMTSRGKSSIRYQPGRVSRSEAERQQQRIARNYVDPWLETWWPRLDFRQEYATLLSDPERLAELSRGAISVEDARAMLESARQPLYDNFDDSDRGALAYLDHLLNDTIRRRYRHIVVDEAQDISPIEFRLLRLSSVNNWFTILGDTAQQLTPYRGIRRWRDIERSLGRSSVKVQHARTSYRSNQHITRFNNRILRLFDSYIVAPIPFGREGHRVEYHRHAGVSLMYEEIVRQLDRIRSLDGLNNAQIAVLVRDRSNFSRFAKFCQENGVAEVTPFGQESLESRTVLARIPDTKGLEYDAVIVLGVNDSFASTTFNRKLLYLASTRAKHYLAIHCGGRPSPIMQAISQRGMQVFDSRRRRQ